jgi:uncharacterized protein (DUF2345 family)
MAADPKEKLATTHTEDAAETSETSETEDKREVYLKDGRTLTVASQGRDELVEIRASSGQLELRIKLTEEGPVLQMESVRMSLRAAEAIDLEAKHVNVKAEDKVAIESGGALEIKSDGDLEVKSTAEVRINGKLIYLN